jgi:hypothetical protein
MKNYNTGERFYQSYPYRSGKEESERPLSWCMQRISPFLPKMNLISPGSQSTAGRLYVAGALFGAWLI